MAAGFLDGLITYPLELLKIRISHESKATVDYNRAGRAAAAAAGKPFTPKQSPGLTGVAKLIVQRDGVLGFYKGIRYHLAGEVAKSAWRFLLFNSARQQYVNFARRNNPNRKLGVLDNVVIATISSIGETLSVVQPWDRLKTLSIDNKRPMQIIREEIRKGGIRGCLRSLYWGVDLSLVRQWGNSVFGFALFYYLENLALKSSGRTVLTSNEKFIYGGLAGAAGAVATQPFDVMKSIKQKESGGKTTQTRELARQLYANDGVKAFYKGLSPRIGLLFMKRGIAWLSFLTIQEAIESAFGAGPRKH
eukprot:TRINITY_DN7127_c0_g1_i1.p1 TRINITY_DN7127_c0_g1~~TRINITY_DN7127_c0_g1_i1.p1  ORF type:complete len:340 (-),score=96.03 TRINITY_DN7127_c0_g1_i1:81-995(-)